MTASQVKSHNESLMGKLGMLKHMATKNSIFKSTLTVWFIQLVTLFLLLKELLDSEAIKGAKNTALKTSISTARVCTGVVLHVVVQPELTQGLQKMKHAVNHPWKFSDYKLAFWAGFLQTSICFIVEIVNFLVILSSEGIIDIVADFLVVLVISDFDNYFYLTNRHDDVKRLITDDEFARLKTIQQTSSNEAKAKIEEHKLANIDIQTAEKNA